MSVCRSEAGKLFQILGPTTENLLEKLLYHRAEYLFSEQWVYWHEQSEAASIWSPQSVDSERYDSLQSLYLAEVSQCCGDVRWCIVMSPLERHKRILARFHQRRRHVQLLVQLTDLPRYVPHVYLALHHTHIYIMDTYTQSLSVTCML